MVELSGGGSKSLLAQSCLANGRERRRRRTEETMQAPLARVRPRKPLAMVAADTGRGAAPLCSPTNQTKRTASLHPGTETDNDPSLRRTVPARHLRSLLWPADRDKEIFVSPLNCASCSCQHDPVHVLLVRGMTRTRRTGHRVEGRGRAPQFSGVVRSILAAAVKIATVRRIVAVPQLERAPR
jgi:hypothetical protein